MRSIIALFLKNGGFVVFVLLEALSFYLAIRNNETQANVWANTSMVFGGKMHDQRRRITKFLDLERVADSLHAENAALRAELLRRQNIQVNLLDTMYSVKIDSVKGSIVRPEYSVIPCQVVGNTVGGANNWLTINRGRKNGITEDCGIISRKGLVGIVRYVGDDYAMAMSMLHRQTKVSATLRGRLGSLVWKDNNPSEMTLQDIPKDVQPILGDTVRTSGYSTLFPKGVMIGVVSEITLPAGGNFYSIKIRLSHNLADSRDVYVIKNLFKPQIDSLQRLADHE